MHTWRGIGARRLEVAAFLLLLAAYLFLALVYGVVTPDLEAPDAGAHFRYVAYLREHPQLPSYDQPTAQVSHELVQQPPLYYALVAGLLAGLQPAADVQATVAYEQSVLTPYFEKGLGKRVSVTPPQTDPAVVWPLRLARGVSLLGGALMVATTWGLARALLCGRRALPLAITAVVAFNPQFLFSSTTITNDIWAAALATAAVCAAAWAAWRQARWFAWLAVGALCGLATLTKYSGVMTLLPVALVAVALRPAWNWRSFDAGKQVIGALLGQGLLVALGFLAITGSQFAHNLVATGELIPMQSIRALLPGLVRPEPLSGEVLQQRVAFLTRSYTGIFGYGVRASAGFFEVVDGAVWLFAIGSFVLWVKAAVSPQRRCMADLLRAWVLALIWFLALLGSLATWIRVMIAGEQGRLLFPAAAAVATLLVIGWIGFLPRRAQGWAAAALVIGMLAVGVWQAQTVTGFYAPPPAIAPPLTPDRAVDATFADGMQLVGFDLPAGAATEIGRPLPITLYFRAVQAVPEDSTMFLHLVDAEDRMLYQFDGIPYGGRHPPRQWRVGELFADRYTITPQLQSAAAISDATGAGTTLASLSLGFYPVLRPAERIAVFDAQGQPIGDRLQLATIRILPLGGQAAIRQAQAEGDSERAPIARWQHGIVLDDARVVQETAGAPQTLQVRWRAEENGHQDFTVFLQALDADGNLLAQVDQQPQGGLAPTSTWLAGEQFADEMTFTQPATGWQQIIIGLYDGAGRRLPLAAGDEPTADYFVVLRRPS